MYKNEALFADWPIEHGNAVMQEGLTILRRYIEQWNEADFHSLKRDYARLFVGPTRLQAPPWESVYRGEEHLLFEEETLQVRAMYRQFGFAVPSTFVQPDDHFGLEMLFVAHLCRLGTHALQDEQALRLDSIRQALTAFFADHICQWSDQFLSDVRTKAATPYYQGLALLASGCIAHTVTRWHMSHQTMSTS